MNPTTKLRFVVRDIGGKYVNPQKILQQWFEPPGGCDLTLPEFRRNGEWRDVEVVKDATT